MKFVAFNGSFLLKSEISGANLLLKELGKEDEMLKRQAEYEEKKESGPWGSEEQAKLFEGVSENEINEKAKEIVKANIRGGAGDLIKELKEKDVFVAVYSNDLINILEALAEELGLDSAYGTTLEFDEGIATGKLAIKTERYDRAKKIKEYIDEHGPEEVFIIGDSITAVPSAELGTMIAYNSESAELNEVAQYKISDFSEILSIVG